MTQIVSGSWADRHLIEHRLFVVMLRDTDAMSSRGWVMSASNKTWYIQYCTRDIAAKYSADHVDMCRPASEYSTVQTRPEIGCADTVVDEPRLILQDPSFHVYAHNHRSARPATQDLISREPV